MSLTSDRVACMHIIRSIYHQVGFRVGKTLSSRANFFIFYFITCHFVPPVCQWNIRFFHSRRFSAIHAESQGADYRGKLGQSVICAGSSNCSLQTLALKSGQDQFRASTCNLEITARQPPRARNRKLQLQDKAPSIKCKYDYMHRDSLRNSNSTPRRLE